MTSQLSDTFTMDCPQCGPGTVEFVAGRQLPHTCGYEPPSVVIDCITGVARFAEEMRERNIHVGVGAPSRCVTCGDEWPCPGDPDEDTTYELTGAGCEAIAEESE